MQSLVIHLIIIAMVSLAVGCSAETETKEQTVNRMLEEGNYEEALEVARAQADETGEDALLIDAHLAYANYLTHEADHLAMGERMADALAHFRRVLKLDDTNTQAQSHIELIEGIYGQLGREVPQGVAE